MYFAQTTNYTCNPLQKGPNLGLNCLTTNLMARAHMTVMMWRPCVTKFWQNLTNNDKYFKREI
jgi:hypothetical protein